MKNLLKIGLFALCICVLAAGCSGCGEKLSGGSEKKIDTPKATIDSPKKVNDTTKAAIDTAKKDTSKKK
jgi:hypothetical protein